MVTFPQSFDNTFLLAQKGAALCACKNVISDIDALPLDEVKEFLLVLLE